MEKRRVLMKSYISSHFNYCLLIWICHNKKLNYKIDKVHERALRIVYGSCKSSFQENFKKDNSIIFRQKNLQYFQIRLSPLIMIEVYKFSVRSGIHLENSNIHTLHFGSESKGKGFLEPKSETLFPSTKKTSETLSISKKNIKIRCQIFSLGDCVGCM